MKRHSNKFVIHRPWGWMLTFIHTRHFWLKFLHIRKGQRTSWQYHELRDELHLSLFDILYVPVYERHRMTEGNYIEVAWGRHVAEDDNLRLEDDYDRT